MTDPWRAFRTTLPFLRAHCTALLAGALPWYSALKLAFMPTLFVSTADDINGAKNDLPPLSKGKLKDYFYIRNLYGNIEDAFNRPVYSSPEDWIDVGIREPEHERGYFSRLVTTPQSRRCLNLGALPLPVPSPCDETVTPGILFSHLSVNSGCNDFAGSYNYLGFGGVNTHCTPQVAQSALHHPITSGSTSAELGHNLPLRDVEETVARFVGKPAACVVGMGFATNSTVIPALCAKGDLILSDSLNHNSIVEGVRLSGAKVKPFKHNCVGDLELLLQDAVRGSFKYNKIIVVVEGIYSMEGELCRLPEIVKVAKMYGAYVYLDEAHSIGAVGPSGRGVCEELGVDTRDVDIMMGTFTKSFGAAGGYIASDPATIAQVRHFAAGLVDAVSMPPAVCTQILASLRVIAGEDGTDIGAKKLRQLRDNAKFFREGLESLGLEVLGHHPSPVMPVMLYQPYKIGDFSRLAFNRGLAVVVVGAPATPVTLPRVRFGATETCLQVAGIPATLSTPVARRAMERGWAHDPKGFFVGRDHPPYTHVRVVDDQGADVRPGTLGRFVTKGDNLFTGYVGQPDADEEWYRGLGDLGFWLCNPDDGGVDLYWHAREAGMILRGGANYSCASVDEHAHMVLRTVLGWTRGVEYQDVASVGVPLTSDHEDACCILVEGVTHDESRVREALMSDAWTHKVRLDRVEFGRLPRNFKGTVQLAAVKLVFWK